MKRLQSSGANIFAIARPIPLEAPVISIFFMHFTFPQADRTGCPCLHPHSIAFSLIVMFLTVFHFSTRFFITQFTVVKHYFKKTGIQRHWEIIDALSGFHYYKLWE